MDSQRVCGAAVVLSLLFVSLALAGCDDSSGSDAVEVPESQLEFVPRRSVAPDLETMDTAFWAVMGEDRRLEIRYQGQGGSGTGKRFLELEIRDETLLRRPNGTRFAIGDSIEIRVVVDTIFFLASFEPTGLAFNPQEPAVLEIDYDEAESDFLAREAEFDLWRQERPGDLWMLIGSGQIEELDEIEADLLGFTRYGLAIGR